MKIVISNTSDSPLYQQIKDQIKDAILKEELVEGDRYHLSELLPMICLLVYLQYDGFMKNWNKRDLSQAKLV